MTPPGSDSAAGGRAQRRTAGSGSSRASVRLGLTLRSVLLSPAEGFGAAMEATARRRRSGERLPEGVATYVLTALGGVSLMLLWLKVGGLLGRRRVATSDFEPAVFVSLLVLGALLCLIALAAWSALGPWLLRRLGGDVRGHELRLIWGASAFPQVFALLVLLPLDLVIVGPATFTTERLTETLSAAWASLSIALSLCVAAWSAFLFWRGLGVGAELGRLRALLGTAVALVLLAALVGALVMAGNLAMGRWP